MTMVPSITESHIRNAIVRAVQNVFSTLISRDATPRPPGAATLAPATYQLLASVGFVGEANGVVHLCLRDDFARFATSEVLGLGAGDETVNDPDVVKDAIGEMANMTVGGFKNQLCDLGFPCKLTLPIIVTGSELKVAVLKGAERHVVEFDCAGHALVADIQLKTS
jgi:chemotaxis protein CheX